MATIKETIIEYKRKNPSATYEEIALRIKKLFPGCKTNAASVSCTLSRLKRTALGGDVDALSGGLSFLMTPDELPEDNPEETDEEARTRIKIRFDAMSRLGERLVQGKIPSMIVSGPPGVGKSFTLMQILANSGRQRHDGMSDVNGGGDGAGWYDHIRGAMTAVGLYHAMWNMRNGGILFIDDCDDVFRDETTRDLLKVATDSTSERNVSWRKNSAWLEEYGIDRMFDFKGHIVFLTNIDFERVIETGNQQAEHFKALIDRAAYLCLTLRTQRDFMIHLRNIADGASGMLAKKYKMNAAQRTELLDFIDENKTRFYNLSLRLVDSIAQNMRDNEKTWKLDTEATKMRTL